LIPIVAANWLRLDAADCSPIDAVAVTTLPPLIVSEFRFFERLTIVVITAGHSARSIA